MDDDIKAYPLLGSITNDVGLGFLGNQTVAATAGPLRVRVISMTTGFASARGGVEGRMTFGPNIQDFRRGLSFVIRQEPQVLLLGYIPRYEFVVEIAEALANYSGVVVLDPVIGDAAKGLYVSEETLRAIRTELVPNAQIITPNRFEAELLTERQNEPVGEYRLLDELMALGPLSVVVTSWRRDAKARIIENLFANAYGHTRIKTPYLTAMPGYGAGDAFAAAMATFSVLGAAPLSSAVLSTVFASQAVAKTTLYGHATVDPMAVHETFRPRGYYDDQIRALRYAQRFGVETMAIKPGEGEGAMLRPIEAQAADLSF